MNHRYRKVLQKGRPTHEKGDSFFVDHPPMPLSKRAKIFLPFDALKGFDEALRSKAPASGEDTYDTME
ncbi:MAG: hypothetical protein E7294_01620 [Lachnospiraceae bacterium]|jgi:hypothetical protein|nr:hypothetical protein [Lachnospiraceae bacterium]